MAGGATKPVSKPTIFISAHARWKGMQGAASKLPGLRAGDCPGPRLRVRLCSPIGRLRSGSFTGRIGKDAGGSGGGDPARPSLDGGAETFLHQFPVALACVT